MKLLIISNMAHYRRDGEIVGFGPAATEIEHLGQIFSDIRHIGCLHEEPALASALPYLSDKIVLVPVPPAGGSGVSSKLDILRLIPLYARVILKELPKADVVHVRCPANITLLAIVLMAFVRRPRLGWVKYAGNWSTNGSVPLSYRLQRWWLNKGLHRGNVTINGNWPGQPAHVHSFINPCLSAEDEAEAGQAAVGKELTNPMRLLLVGRVETAKGVGRALHILAGAAAQGVEATLDLVGDGPERPAFEKLADELGIRHLVTFHGWLARPDIAPLYARAHIKLFPSSSEGWPKVLSEAMAYGVVPLSADVGSIKQYLEEFECGKTFAYDDQEGFINALREYSGNPVAWKRESENGVKAAKLFSYSNYLSAVRSMLGLKPAES